MSQGDSERSEEARRRKRKNLLINLALLVGAVVLYFVVLEVVLRAGDPEPPHEGVHQTRYHAIYQRSLDPVLRYELAPGKNGIVNADGFIDRDYPLAKPAGVKRIVGLGDSITMYQTVEGTNYLTRLETMLEGVEVLNMGVGGYDTAQEVRLLELKGLRYDPDIVVVGYCLNDGFDDYFIFNEVTNRLSLVEERRAEIPELAEIEGMDGDGEQRSLAITRFFERKVQAASADLTKDEFYQLVFASKAWKSSAEALAKLATLSRERGLRVVLVVFPFMLEGESYFFDRMHERVRQEADKHGFGVVDLTEPFAAAGMVRLRVHPQDHIHPGDEGHKIAAEALAAWLVEHAGLDRSANHGKGAPR